MTQRGGLLGVYCRLLAAIGPTPWGNWLTIRVMTPVDRALYRRTKGKVLATGPMLFPTLLLITTGRRSGQERTVPLLYTRDGGRIILATAHLGKGHAAQWPKNLLAHPVARVQIGGGTSTVRARHASGEELERYWALMLQIWPGYTREAARSGKRSIFVLEPLPDAVDVTTVEEAM
jgi:deazaflavin-dependent oxidoreductase (nitroreductase family)